MDYLGRVEKQLDLPPSEKAEVMKELRTHYEEFVEEMMASGMDRSQAELEAADMIGRPEDIAADMRTVHVQASWKVTALVALPFVLSIIAQLLQTSARLSGAQLNPARFLFIPACTVLMAWGSMREIIHNRRPLWLATWLPASLSLIVSLVSMVVHVLTPSGAHAVSTALIVGATIVISVPNLSIGIWAAWPNPKLLGAVICSQLVAFLMVAATLRWHQDAFLRWVTLIWIPVGSIPMTIVALRVFRPQRPGGFTVASLFLFTSFLLGISTIRGGLSPWHLLSQDYLMLFTPLATAIVFARAKKWQFKLLSLAVAIVLLQFMLWYSGLQLQWDPWRFIDTLVMLGVVIVVPLLLEKRTTLRKPEIAA